MLRINHRKLSFVLLPVLLAGIGVCAHASSPAPATTGSSQITGTDPEPIEPYLIDAILTVFSMA
jgi:hypothetical protein